MNKQPKQFTIYIEMFRLIDRIENVEKRDEFLGKLFDWYFKDKKPNLEPNSYEEDVWINITKPIISYKSKVVNGSKGGRPRRNKKTEVESEIKSENESETITTSDVIVVVNNNTLNKNKKNIISKESNTNEDSNRDRVAGKEEEKETFPNSILDFVEKNYGRSLTPYEFEEVSNLVETYSEPIILKAYKIAFEQGHNKLSYIKGILSTWKDCGLDTLEKIEEDLKKGKRSASERKLDAVFARARARMGEENE
ncbi:dnaD domain protein [Clostridium sp. CAG:1000]|nr:dnaD domain protein [Clostridium sp. CAG:1000]